MRIVNLYRYEGEDGSVSITPNKKNEDDVLYCYRLIADEGMLLTDGENQFYCIDTIEKEKFYEIEDIEHVIPYEETEEGSVVDDY